MKYYKYIYVMLLCIFFNMCSYGAMLSSKGEVYNAALNVTGFQVEDNEKRSNIKAKIKMSILVDTLTPFHSDYINGKKSMGSGI